MDAGWINRGLFSTIFLFFPPSCYDSELWFWEAPPGDPPGVCLALPRWWRSAPTGCPTDAPTPIADHAEAFSVICMGRETSRACFFDNPGGTRFPRGEVRDITDFFGGTDLLGNDGGPCTSCHAGRNPFVVHPDDAVFDGLPGSLRPLEWYEPIVPEDVTWPHNPGPITLPPVSDEPSCGTASCHGANRNPFPDLGAAGMEGYCNRVFENAVDASGTMPPQSVNIPASQYVSHLDYLESACTYGNLYETEVLTPGPADDSSFISPPRVLPMYECASVVGVTSMRLGAEVELIGFDGANEIFRSSKTVRNPDGEQFNLPFELDPGQHWEARQRMPGDPWSVTLPAVVPRDYLNEYTSPPIPEFHATPLYACAELMGVGHLPGATIEVEHDGGSTQWPGSAVGLSVVGFADALEPTEQVRIRQTLCGDESQWSGWVTVVPEPDPIDRAGVTPTTLYQGQELLVLGNLIPGSSQDLESNVAGSFASLSPWMDFERSVDLDAYIGRGLVAGETVTVQQSFCDAPSDPYVSQPTAPCSLLPPAELATARDGDEVVLLRGQQIPGASTRVYSLDESKEIGDSGSRTIHLSRPLAAGETITLTRQLGSCVPTTHYQYTVSP